MMEERDREEKTNLTYHKSCRLTWGVLRRLVGRERRRREGREREMVKRDHALIAKVLLSMVGWLIL